MATKKKTYKLEGVQEVISKLKTLDARLKSQVMKSLLRKLANKMKTPLTSNAPNTENNTFKNRRNISTVADREKRGAVKVGYIKKAYTARWIERGTKMRTTRSGASRGRIRPQPWIDKTHREEVPKLVRELNETVTKMMVEILGRKSKTIRKKLNR